ncbi:hypothetical protein EYF80_015021 [Liparis tanakae]|uniref:Uncharacterized protein n=1 Tax=Liparis tanakae TaxID=230148 RepID=A0A4Z2ICB0_9TELE|nr:hypothetical protein EYF80_015021 [Liparis tanakae]
MQKRGETKERRGRQRRGEEERREELLIRNNEALQQISLPPAPIDVSGEEEAGSTAAVTGSGSRGQLTPGLTGQHFGLLSELLERDHEVGGWPALGIAIQGIPPSNQRER